MNILLIKYIQKFHFYYICYRSITNFKKKEPKTVCANTKPPSVPFSYLFQNHCQIQSPQKNTIPSPRQSQGPNANFSERAFFPLLRIRITHSPPASKTPRQNATRTLRHPRKKPPAIKSFTSPPPNVPKESTPESRRQGSLPIWIL